MEENGDALGILHIEYEAHEIRRYLLQWYLNRNQRDVSPSRLLEEAATIRGHVLNRQQQRGNHSDVSTLRAVHDEAAGITQHVLRQHQLRNVRDHHHVVSISRVHDQAAAIRRHVLRQQEMRLTLMLRMEAVVLRSHVLREQHIRNQPDRSRNKLNENVRVSH